MTLWTYWCIDLLGVSFFPRQPFEQCPYMLTSGNGCMSLPTDPLRIKVPNFFCSLQNRRMFMSNTSFIWDSRQLLMIFTLCIMLQLFMVGETELEFQTHFLRDPDDQFMLKLINQSRWILVILPSYFFLSISTNEKGLILFCFLYLFIVYTFLCDYIF